MSRHIMLYVILCAELYYLTYYRSEGGPLTVISSLGAMGLASGMWETFSFVIASHAPPVPGPLATAIGPWPCPSSVHTIGRRARAP